MSNKILYEFEVKKSEDCNDCWGDEENHIMVYIWPQDVDALNKTPWPDSDQDEEETIYWAEDNLSLDAPNVREVLSPLGIEDSHNEMENTFYFPNTVNTVDNIRQACISAGWIEKEMMGD